MANWRSWAIGSALLLGSMIAMVGVGKTKVLNAPRAHAASTERAEAPLVSAGKVWPIHVPASAPTQLDLPGGRYGSRFAVVVGSLAVDDRLASVRVSLKELPAGATPRPWKPHQPQRDGWWSLKVKHQARQMQQKRDQQAQATPPAQNFKPVKPEQTFHIFVGADDVRDPKQYVAVTAQLVGQGKHCAVYWDGSTPHPARKQSENPNKLSTVQPAPTKLIEQIVSTFDDEVYPNARQTYGTHRDVNGDGKFAILLTGWLNHLCDDTVSLGGFVRGGDFFDDVRPPLSNRCDMMYLNRSLPMGPHLRTLLAHEYTHAITFSEHVFGEYLTDRTGFDEEAWLSEAMAHLGENAYGDGWSNLDYRVSAFLSSPQRYRLVVEDYFRDGLWRCHGARGSTFSFLRWCVDQNGPMLLKKMSQSNLFGLANLEAATQTRFEELFRAWSTDLCFHTPDGALDRWDSRREGDRLDHSMPWWGRLGSMLLAGPRPKSIALGQSKLSLAGTGFALLWVDVPPGQVRRLSLSADVRTHLQVSAKKVAGPRTLVAVSSNLAFETRPSRQTRESRTRPTLQVTLDHHVGPPVDWQWISCEPAQPPAESSWAGRGIVLRADEVFAQTRTQPGQAIKGDAIDVSAMPLVPWVIKLIGVDELGRPVAAWGDAFPGASARPQAVDSLSGKAIDKASMVHPVARPGEKSRVPR